MVDLNITKVTMMMMIIVVIIMVTQVTHVYYEECSDHALRIKIDFDEFSSDPIFQVPSSLFIVIIHPQKITFVTYRQALHRDMHIIVVIFVRNNLRIFVYRKT